MARVQGRSELRSELLKAELLLEFAWRRFGPNHARTRVREAAELQVELDRLEVRVEADPLEDESLRAAAADLVHRVQEFATIVAFDSGEDPRRLDSEAPAGSDRDIRVLLRYLEEALASPTADQDVSWRDRVDRAVSSLSAELDRQDRLEIEHGILSEIAVEAPKLDQLLEDRRRILADLLDAQAAFRAGLETGEVRTLLSGLARRCREHLVAVAELIYEAAITGMG